MNMNKRGMEERTIIYIAFLIFAALIIVIIFGRINGEAKGEVFHQTYIAKDLAMAMNLYDKGDITLNYPIKYNFNVAIASGTVAVRKETPILYSYAQGDYDIFVENTGNELVVRKL